MLIIPAIDLQDGCVVRLVQGKLDKKVYSKDPLKTAKHWVAQGAQMLHVVDLDGALSGKPQNLEIVKEIAGNTAIPIEFGGGIRSMDALENLFDLGVSRAVLGTKAAEDKDFLIKAFNKFKDRIIVSIDASVNEVLTEGWQARSGLNVLEFALFLKDTGFKRVIYTDISKDGTLSGPNIKEIKNLLTKTGLEVIASGGVSSLDDLRKLKLLENQGLIGVIVGKALYEGKFTLKEAINQFQKEGG